jgi:dinuclear metal center YbgI/SA1388 family protein
VHPETLIATLENTADPGRAAEWDLSGLQIAGTRNPVRRLAVSLDPHATTIKEALDWGADFILTHHPLTLSPRLPDRNDSFRQILKEVLKAEAWLYAAHTSLDVATTGPVSWLARHLGLEEIKPILETTPETFWADVSELADEVESNQALSSERGIRVLHSPGGRTGLVFEKAQRFKVKTILNRLAPEAMLPIHECAWNMSQCGYGVLGRLPAPRPWNEIRQTLAGLFQPPGWVSMGSPPKDISCIAYCPGSGMDLAEKAFAQGAQLFLSGDAKYHLAQSVEPLGLTLDVGHFALEEMMMAAWARDLAAELSAKSVQVRHIPGHNPQRIEKD